MWQVVAPFPDARGKSIDVIEGRRITQLIPAIKTVKQGVLNIFVRGSGAALSVNENCDPTVRSDMTEALLRLCPQRPSASADDTDNARALLMSSSLTLPVEDGKISFGTWQGVYFARHRADASGELVFTLFEGATQAGFTFNANTRSGHPIAVEVDRSLQEQGSRKGFGTILVHEKHTSASISIAGDDLEPAMRKIVPETWNTEFFQHTYEGPDDMPGHMKSTLLGCSVMFPTTDGCASLGLGQQVMLNEHRDVGGFGCGHQRKVQVTQLPAAAQRVLSLPASVASASLTDLTTEFNTIAAEIGGGKAGMVHVFVASAMHGIVVGCAGAAKVLASALRDVTADERARAAICKNGPCVPLGSDGKLMLVENQGIWLYCASGDVKEQEASEVALTVVATFHCASL